MKHSLTAILVAGALLAGLPSAAHASTWSEGTAGKPFNLADPVAGKGLSVGGTASDQSLLMPYEWRVLYHGSTGSEFDPRSVQALPDGTLLVADGWVHRVLQIDLAGNVVWSYNDPEGNMSAWSAVRRTNGNTVITDRGVRVLEVDSAKRVVRSIEASPGFLEDPFYAAPVGGDHTLVCDGKKGSGSGGCRVVEIDEHGRIVWKYGVIGEPGSGPGRLTDPRTVQRIPAGYVGAGNTLIADEESGRAIEVAPDGRVVWQYTGLRMPSSATRLANGNTLIAESDTSHSDILEVDHSSPAKVVDVYGDDSKRFGAGPAASPVSGR